MTSTRPSSRSRLSPKRLLFVREFLVDCNGTGAAIRAGYSRRSAAVTAARLLRNASISAAVQEGIQKRAAEIDYTADPVLEELARVAFANISDFLMYDPQGRIAGQLDLNKFRREQTAAIQEITVDGMGKIKKLKLANKVTALELLGKFHRLFSDRVEHDMSDELLARLNRGRQRAGMPARKDAPQPSCDGSDQRLRGSNER